MSTQGAVLVVLVFSLAAGPAAPAQVLRPPSVDGAAGNNTATGISTRSGWRSRPAASAAS